MRVLCKCKSQMEYGEDLLNPETNNISSMSKESEWELQYAPTI